MSILLSVDPGTRGAGCAVFCDGLLVAAAYVPNTAKEGGGPRECVAMAQQIVRWVFTETAGIDTMIGSELVVEWPQIYARGAGKTKGDPNQLLPLIGVDCALAAILDEAEVTHYTPHEWKQSTKKPEHTIDPEYIIQRRVKARLSAEELKCVKWPVSIRHGWDIADAIGLGLTKLGLFDRVRKFARE